MHPLYIAAFAVALIAFVGLCFDLPVSWYCGLLSLACLLGAMAEAYEERTPVAIAFLGGAVVIGVTAVFADLRQGSRGGTS